MKILIVDDETVSRKILDKKLGLVGKCTAVQDSKEALNLISDSIRTEKPFDLVTLDVSMPIMNGKKLLSMIRQKEKAAGIKKKDRVKILMVTSRMRTATIKDCIRLGCDGYILKPVHTLPLLENLQRMGLIQVDNLKIKEEKEDTEMVNQVIQNFYSGKIKLPALPKIADQVQELIKKKDPSIEALTQIIQKDIAMTSKLIGIANSPFYKGLEKVDSLNAALVRFGMKATASLVSTLATREMFQSDNEKLCQQMDKLWMHSFTCGLLAKRIAEKLKLDNPESYFLMGIIHDIGKMLLIKIIADIHPDETFEAEETQTSIHEIHTTFGAALLRKLRFSQEAIRTTEFHHWNDFSKDEDKDLPIIHLSDHLANHIGFSFINIESQTNGKDKPGSLSKLKSLKILELELEDVLKIAQEIKPIVEESAQPFS